MAMMSILDHERATYADIWTAVPSYADVAPGERYVSILAEHCPLPARVVDAGCGSGKGALALRRAGYDVMMCDLTSEGLAPEALDLSFFETCLWQPLRPQLRVGSVDAVYCTDVLEHIPPQFTMLAVDQMLRIAARGVLISVSLTTDGFGVWVGRPLHQTVQGFTWWRDSLRELGQVEDARDLLATGVYWVTR